MELTTQQPRVLHSPGPFDCRFGRDGCDDYWEIVDRNAQPVASIVFWDCDETWARRAEANACLLTAAPELLETLKAVLSEVEHLPAGAVGDRLVDLRRRASTLIHLSEVGVIQP